MVARLRGERGWLESLGGLLFYCRQVKCPTSCQAVWLIHCPGIYGKGVQCALGGQVLCWVSLPSWVELRVAPDLLLGNLHPHLPFQWQAGVSSKRAPASQQGDGGGAGIGNAVFGFAQEARG